MNSHSKSDSTGKIKQFLKPYATQKYLLLMMLPGLLVIFIFHYIPIFGIIISFKDYDPGRGILRSEWVGLKWFILFFKNPFAYRLIRNTLLLAFYGLIFSFPAPIILALLLNEIGSAFYKRFAQSISYLPYFISAVIIVGMLKEFSFTDGIFNRIRALVGLEQVIFFSDSRYFRSLFIGSGIWQNVGWGSILYLAAISGVNTSLYESAIIDGASRWRRMLHVTLPSILPTVSILFILSVGYMLSLDVQKVLLMYSPVIYETADIIGTYVFREGIMGARYSYTAAIGFLMSVVSFIFLYLANRLSKVISEHSLW